MKIIDQTLSSPAENLALDESLLIEREELTSLGEALRFWESPVYFAVLGYSNRADSECRLPICQKDGVEVLRRSSGGGTVLQGPGCLNYALLLDTHRRSGLKSITSTNCEVMKQMARALNPLIPGTKVRGITDLAVGGKKFSGNAQRRKRRFCLFHGTILTGMDLKMIETYLAFPSKTPDYREDRSHLDFITNITADKEKIKESIVREWNAEGTADYSKEKVSELVLTRYSKKDWNYKF